MIIALLSLFYVEIHKGEKFREKWDLTFKFHVRLFLIYLTISAGASTYQEYQLILFVYSLHKVAL